MIVSKTRSLADRVRADFRHYSKLFMINQRCISIIRKLYTGKLGDDCAILTKQLQSLLL
jgi:hypothetical protein